MASVAAEDREVVAAVPNVNSRRHSSGRKAEKGIVTV